MNSIDLLLQRYFPDPSPPGIPAGLYSFMLAIQNPGLARQNERDDSATSVCGYVDCWILQTREVMGVRPALLIFEVKYYSCSLRTFSKGVAAGTPGTLG